MSPSPSSWLSPSPSSSSAGGLRSQLGFNAIAADEEFNEPACAMGTCSSELGANWDAKTEGANSYHAAFAGWADIGLTGSELDIQATVDSSGTWTGGWLEGLNLGNFVPPYYVEVRAQVPAVYGMWPAPGWTWSWPYGTTCGVEVDFAEMLGRWPTTVPQTVNGCANPLDKHVTIAPPGIGGWHVYSAAVYAGQVDFYIDGTLTGTTYNSEVPGGAVNRTAPADLTTWLVPGACGSWADCPQPGTPDQHMYVDWIRAWVK